MPHFIDAREAKEFLVSRIVGEAKSEGVALSEVERKMLYFSETAWTLPEMAQTAEAFGREYNQTEYEQKIARLIKNLHSRLRKSNRHELRAWSEAAQMIAKEDHYLLLIARQAGVSVRPSSDLLKLWGTGIAICIGLLFLIFAFPSLGTEQNRESLGFLSWAIACCAVGVCLLFYMIAGKTRTIDLTNRLIDKLLRLSGRSG